MIRLFQLVLRLTLEQVVKNENVKKCRDVIVKKVLKQGWDTRTTHYTHVGPMTPYIVVITSVSSKDSKCLGTVWYKLELRI